MAEDVENPRKKQKLDDISLQASAIEKSPSSPKKIGIKDHEDKPQNADDKAKSDGGEDRLQSDDLHTSDTEQPSSSQMDLTGSGSDSDSSSMSPLSGEELWKGDSEPLAWVYQMMANEEDPRKVLKELLPNEVPDLDDMSLWRLLMAIVSEPPPRDRLTFVNTISDVIHLIKTCQNIIVLTGAGVSVSCGIPDFRSRNGIYARLAVDFPDLPDPQAMFDIGYFKKDQRPFYKFAKEIYPGEFEPSKCHRFIRLIEEHGKLLRNYTQNIDTLEQVAGIKNVIQCHGSFATATCMVCKHKCSGDDIKKDIYNQVIPKCPKCDPQVKLSIMKPDIVFFGESLPNEFHRQMAADKEKCDLLIVIGSSLKVRPVALIPNSLPGKVPQILINKEHLRALNFDVELLGDGDIIIGELCRQLGDKWDTLANKVNPLKEIRVDELLTPPETPVEMTDTPSKVVDDKDSNANERDSAKPNKNVENHNKKTDIEKSQVSITRNENVDNRSNSPEEEKSCDLGKHLNSGSKDEANQVGASNPSDSLANTESREESVAKTDSLTEKDSTKNATMAHIKNDSKTDAEGTKCLPDDVKKDDDSKDGPGSNKQRKEIDLSKIDDAMAVNKTDSKTDTEGTKSSPEEIKKESDSKDGPDSNKQRKEINLSKIDYAMAVNKTDSKTDTEGTKSSLEEKKNDNDSKEGPGFNKQRKDINLSSMWMPAKWRVSQRLEPYQYCFMPPNRYIFNDAEVFMVIDSDSDMDSTDESYNEKDESDNQKSDITKEEKDVSNNSKNTENTTESLAVEKGKQTESEIAGKEKDSTTESSENKDLVD